MASIYKRIGITLMLLTLLLTLTSCGGPEYTYKSAQELLSKGRYAEAAEKYESIGSYEDASTLAMYCKACALCEDGDFDTGIAGFKSLGGFKDCAYRITYYTARSWDDSSVGTTEFEWMERAKKIYQDNPLYLDSAERISALNTRIEQAKSTLYNEAVAAGEHGNYISAQYTFNRLDNYKDSTQRYTYYGICADENALAKSTNQDAILVVAARYTDMGTFLDCAKRAVAMKEKAAAIVTQKYAAIVALMDEGKYADAEVKLATFGEYGNEQVLEHYYYLGEAYLSQNQWDAASFAFIKAGKYSDATNRVNEPYYKQGEALLLADDETGAIAAFKKAGTYGNATERWGAIYYMQAERLMDEGNEIGAISAFKNAGTYSDAIDRWRALYYEKAESLVTEGRYTEASAAYSAAVGYRDALSKAYDIQYRYLFTSRIATSSQITIGLEADGTPVEDAYYALGYKNPDEWNQLIAVSASGGTALGLKSDGTVVIADTYSKKPDNVSYWKDIIAIETGTSGHVVGLKIDGTVVAAGNNSAKQCAVWDWENIVDIAAGYKFTAGLKADGTVVIAGDDTLVDAAYKWVDIISIEADSSNLVGLKSDGTVTSTSFGHRSAESWKGIKAIAVGDNHLVGLREDGTVVGTGYRDYYGKCDVTDWKNIVAIAAGDDYTIGLVSNGTVVTVVHDNQYCDRLNLSSWNLSR